MRSKNRNLSIVDSDLKVEGELHSKGQLVIRGTVQGTIHGASVVIAQEGKVFCDMRVKDLTIGGVFEGTVTATEKVVILSTGRCSGVVESGDLVVESGGILNAQVTSTKVANAEPPLPAPAKEPKEAERKGIRKLA